MKTLKDLEAMKTQKSAVFGNAYEFLMERLADYYVSKIDGENRIKAELSEWDTEAKQAIIQEVGIRVKGMGLQDFAL